MHKTMLSIAAAAGVALGCALTGMAAETQVPGMPLIAGADGAGGYAADVLEKLLPVWQPPAGASGVVTISLRIGSDGRPLYCEAIRKSGNAALDESPCQSVVRAGSFGTPPYGAITEVFLTFATDRSAFGGPAQPQAAAPQQRSYAEEIMFRAKPYIQIPQGANGEYTVELTLRINATGGIEQMEVSKSSGRPDVDNAVLTGVIREGVIPPRPEGSQPTTMRLLFTLKNN
ncbi:MAG TPA: TonB C-terminal domain-containing protein [Candidatus Bilophila faecipullorum]|uniref:TonB C-terminal domain-containing protein n=1 Tax=Candidatus Bilophila faecipullorum TaxID=2838482 RepID=A0A9D1R400_9BACT|nr:TonB family protein [uncultured Bilophila sp.]HIW79706.1 TonB C-terminal domain-containing protein [Candidatus Bilophila faecipullorum]